MISVALKHEGEGETERRREEEGGRRRKESQHMFKFHTAVATETSKKSSILTCPRKCMLVSAEEPVDRMRLFCMSDKLQTKQSFNRYEWLSQQRQKLTSRPRSRLKRFAHNTKQKRGNQCTVLMSWVKA